MLERESESLLERVATDRCLRQRDPEESRHWSSPQSVAFPLAEEEMDN